MSLWLPNSASKRPAFDWGRQVLALAAANVIGLGILMFAYRGKH